jgi:hypothetical protein
MEWEVSGRQGLGLGSYRLYLSGDSGLVCVGTAAVDLGFWRIYFKVFTCVVSGGDVLCLVICDKLS